MKNIPSWIIDGLIADKIKCCFCKKSFNVRDLKAIGIREVYNNPQNEKLFIELLCRHCNKLNLLEIRDMSLLDLSHEIIMTIEEEEGLMGAKEEDFYQKKSRKEGGNNPFVRKEKSKITLKDIQDSSTFLNSIESHDDFLISMGMSPEEVQRYLNKKHVKEIDESQD